MTHGGTGPPDPVLDLLRRQAPAASTQALAVFLAVCARDGASMKGLAKALETSQSAVIRAAGELAGDLGLVEIRDGPAGPTRRTVHLTDAGHALRDRLAVSGRRTARGGR